MTRLNFEYSTVDSSTSTQAAYKGVTREWLALPRLLFTGIASVSLIFILSFTSSISFAQDIPQIVLPAAEASPPQEGIRPLFKSRRVSSALAQLEGRFTRLQLPQQNGTDVESGVDVEAGFVSIEATAKDDGEALLEDLKRFGLVGGASFGKLVSGRLSLSAISGVENLPSLNFIRLSRPISRVGSVDSQGDIAMQTDIARATFSVDGTGISIGILSDSYNQLGGEFTDIASGDLPSNFTVLDDTAVGFNSDEGRAMAQLIHDIAPGADLLFHTAFNGAADFAAGIIDLASAGADVIVDDVGYLNSPMFQDGVVAQAVNQVVSTGVSYFSAAGNSADASYEAPYLDSGLSQNFFNNSITLTNLHAFDGVSDTVQEFIIANGANLTLSIQWDNPFASAGGLGATTDVDAFLVDSALNILAASTDSNIAADAVEILTYQNTTGVSQVVGLLVGVFSGPVPGRLKWIDFGDPKPVNHATNSSTVFAHPNANGAMAIGAAQYNQTPPFGVDPAILQPFSSSGGLEVLFDIAGNPLTAPDDRNKPDVVAPDGTDNTFFGGGDFDGTGFPNFFGTSAAAPHAAAVAALQLECDTGYTPADIRFQQTAPATDMESPGFDNLSGSGLIDAVGTLSLACAPQPLCAGLVPTVFIANGDMATAGPDIILGTPGADNINALGGDDIICGLAGDDTINAGGGDDSVFGDEGDDRLLGTAGNDTLSGGIGNDTILGGNDDDSISGGDGDDTLFGQTGADFISGDNGIDAINGGAGDDMIFTGIGGTVGSSAFVTGAGGNDTIFGDIDNDDLRGSNGADLIFGGAGNDFITGGFGRDELNGGLGDDTIRGQSSRDILFGDQGNDLLEGGVENDIMNGGEGDDTLVGGPGNDTLRGDEGSDQLRGGSDDDSLEGGADTGDVCNGQVGTDTADDSCETLVSIP